jgi:hypothetical protein
MSSYFWFLVLTNRGMIHRTPIRTFRPSGHPNTHKLSDGNICDIIVFVPSFEQPAAEHRGTKLTESAHMRAPGRRGKQDWRKQDCKMQSCLGGNAFSPVLKSISENNDDA